MYDARLIANEFIRRGLDEGRRLTPMHVQKLVFFAHARLLAFYKKPLIMQTFEAWEHGPVVRSLYDDLRSYGGQGVTEVIPLPAKEQALIQDHGAIDWCYKTYGHVSALTLSDLTHSPDGPWAHTGRNAIISNDKIREYYAEPWIAEERDFVARVSRHPEIVADVEESYAAYERGEYYTAAPTLEEELARREKPREERDADSS